MRNLTPEEFQKKWPKLRPDNYKEASHASPRYNCLAFVNGDERHKWEFGRHGGRFSWPEGVPDSLEGWTEIFVRQGYAVTDVADKDVEPGYEKIAIYEELEGYYHVAMSDGRSWKSKLGNYQDIEHATLDLLEGFEQAEYGKIVVILKRKSGAT